MIILVRHGEANHHTEDLTGGWTDSKLTAKGILQIERLATHLGKFLKNKRPLVIASDLQRAQHSARIITSRLSLESQCYDFLREKNNGEAAGKTNTQAKTMKLTKIKEDPDHRNYNGGETRREFFTRVKDGMDNVMVEHDNRSLIVVSHKGTIQNIIFWWLNLSIDEVCRLGISFNAAAASMSVLNINKWNEHEISLLNYRIGYSND